MRNYGLKIDEIKDEDYGSQKLGAILPFEILREDGDWSSFLPIKEFQNLNNIEPYACVSFTVLNCIEILIKQQYGIERNYSDRFLAAVSGTKDGGNSPQVVSEFLRKIGVVPQDLWPFDETVNTFDKFYSPIPPKLYELAREFNQEWEFKHEYCPVNHASITKALKCSPLLVSVSAWFKNESGRFYRPKGMQDNHATTLIYEREGEFMRVFDSYESPHIKDVEWGSLPTVIKRFWVKKRTSTPKGFWLWEIIKKIFGIV